MKDLYQVIDTIQLSEKATILQDTNNEYVFKVELKKVEKVRTCNYSGKKKRERRADFGKTKKWKKAFVRLAEGEEIDLT